MTAPRDHEPSRGQARVIAFLASSGAFEPAAAARYETHIAYVFVGHERALKIKRAVKLPFLDFSTLEKRRIACMREIEVNRPNAPDLYLGLVPIVERSDGTLGLGGPGTPVEWAVEMRAFDQSRLLSSMARDGALDAGLCDLLADAVHRMHGRAALLPAQDLPRKMAAIIAEVGQAIPESSPDMRGAADSWRNTASRERADRTELLRTRAESGAVRRCHGDLHLANVVVIGDRPTLFDALEFSDEMATVDVLYDLAFLLMDLDRHGQRAAANAVLNRYLWRSRHRSDVEALALLPLYLSCRAGIRAMVAGQRAAILDGRDPEHHSREDAQTYLALATGYLQPPGPRLIAVGGLSGTGKTTLARALAPDIGRAPGALHLRSDLERKATMGVEPTERLPAESYTRERAAEVYARLLDRAGAALEAGHSVVVDAVFADPNERAQLAALGHRLGLRLEAVWLDADPAILAARVAARTGDASDATPQVVERQVATGSAPLDWPHLKAGGDAAATLQAAFALLNIGPTSEQAGDNGDGIRPGQH